MSSTTPVKEVGPVVTLSNVANTGPNPTETKTNTAASCAINKANQPGNGPSLQGRADQASVGRTWPQFGQLVASYLTLGLVRAPNLTPPPSTVETAVVAPPPSPVVVESPVIAPKPDANSAKTNNPETPPRTYVQRALDFIKSIFTGLYNLLFGVGA